MGDHNDLIALFEGKLIDNRYLVGKKLGAGGFGVVFEAKQEVMGHFMRRTAIKILKATDITAEQAGEILTDAILLARIIDEIQNSDAKRYLVRIYDVGVLKQYQNRAFIAMEFVPGIPLQKRMKQFKRMPMEMFMRYVQQICQGLAALHTLKEPVIHRDLKPENILLTENDEVRIIDFGLAARLELVRGFVPGTAGTEGYMSPETMVRQESTCASDVYSMGVIMYQMLTGQHPFEHLVPPASVRHDEEAERHWLLNEKRHNMPTPPDQLNNTVDAHLSSVIMKCLRFYEYDRYPNAQQLLEALSVVQPNGGGGSGSGTRDAKLDEGLRYAASGDWATAESAYREGLIIEPNADDDTSFRLNYRLGLALIEQARGSEALQALDRAEKLNNSRHFLTTRRARSEFYGSIAEAAERHRLTALAIRYRNLERKEAASTP